MRKKATKPASGAGGVRPSRLIHDLFLVIPGMTNHAPPHLKRWFVQRFWFGSNLVRYSKIEVAAFIAFFCGMPHPNGKRGDEGKENFGER
jgi:hypothetical protein